MILTVNMAEDRTKEELGKNTHEVKELNRSELKFGRNNNRGKEKKGKGREEDTTTVGPVQP